MKFPRQARLTKPAEFKHVFASPAVSSDRCFRVLTRLNTLGISRLGMAVSKKACRHAVGRNRIKRIIRESFRTHREELLTGLEEGRGAVDIVVLPTMKTTTISNRVLTESLNRHWHRISEKSGTGYSEKMSRKTKGSAHRNNH
jgi:ribonuclease P protein component